MIGRSQAVRIPRKFRLPGKDVSIKRVDGGLLLEPIPESTDEIYAEMDRCGPFDIERDQPPMPDDEPDDMFD